ncbi:hypothetical protein GR232_22715 [Rhizobium leguminosarum]|nr:hypothetical protein [Rhizobium ruizarguesonis]NEI29658.1 hypothetical protein [Rhizobium ruizarguesonis]
MQSSFRLTPLSKGRHAEQRLLAPASTQGVFAGMLEIVFRVVVLVAGR